MLQYKNIPVLPGTYKRISRYGRKDETFDELIVRLLDETIMGNGKTAQPDDHGSLQMTLSIPTEVFNELKFRIENGLKDKDGPISTVQEALWKIVDLWLKEHKYNVLQEGGPRVRHETPYGIREEAGAVETQ